MQLVPLYVDGDDGYYGDGSDEEPSNGQICALIEMLHDEGINATYNAADQLANGINESFRHQANSMNRKRRNDKEVHLIILEQQRLFRDETRAVHQRQQSLINDLIEQRTVQNDLLCEVREDLAKIAAQFKGVNDASTSALLRANNNSSRSSQLCVSQPSGSASQACGCLQHSRDSGFVSSGDTSYVPSATVDNDSGGIDIPHTAASVLQMQGGHPNLLRQHPQHYVRIQQQQPPDQQQQRQQQRDISERQKAAAMRKHMQQMRR